MAKQIGQVHVMGGLLVLAAGLVAWHAISKTGSPANVPAVTEDIKGGGTAPQPGPHFVGPEQHIGDVVLTAHRYPAVTGGDITAMINYGFRPLLIPHEKDQFWITAPPSEAVWG
jgi:hypothetical protein